MGFFDDVSEAGSSKIRRKSDAVKTSRWLDEGDKQREWMVWVSCIFSVLCNER